MLANDILKAWLRALADAQPEFGPLLQSTVDEVGPLPAAGAGAICTIDHDTYRFHAGKSKAFVTAYLEPRINRLAVEGQDARKAKDEQTMVKKEGEARFWHDVSDWVSSRGAGRMRPDPPPAWVAKLNIEYEPKQ